MITWLRDKIWGCIVAVGRVTTNTFGGYFRYDVSSIDCFFGLVTAWSRRRFSVEAGRDLAAD